MPGGEAGAARRSERVRPLGQARSSGLWRTTAATDSTTVPGPLESLLCPPMGEETSTRDLP